MDLLPSRAWLLVGDIVGSNRLNQSLPAEELAVLLGGWFRRYRKVIEADDGRACLLSEPACREPGRHVVAEPVGEHELPGFADRHVFYRPRGRGGLR